MTAAQTTAAREPVASTVEERSIEPVVRRSRTALPTSAIVAITVALGLILFFVLDARRRALSAPTTDRPRMAHYVETVPPLYIPPAPTYVPPLLEVPTSRTPEPAPAIARAVPIPQAQTPTYTSPPQITQQPPLPVAPPAPPRTSAGPALVIDNTAASGQSSSQASGASAQPGDAASATANSDRARAGMLANRSTTVIQGTLIPAVLETGFNSTQAGFARAIVQRDIRGFDGRQVLIPRGSRLIGEYRGDARSGQKRALINWTRLIRPDGVTISIGSPATDPVGRGGIKANVDSHFWERFSGAVLQSVLNVGVNLAARSSNSPVIVALPGNVQSTAATVAQPTQIPPTLSVRPGTSVSVFVARDLDFSLAGGGM